MIESQESHVRRPWEDVLTEKHLRQIFTVLELVQDAPTGERFRETVTEAIARVFGVRKATLFFGTAYDEIVEDAEPPLIGIPASLFPQYQEKWAARDIFNLPEARRRLVDSGFATVDDLDRLPAPQEHYIRDFLVPNGMAAVSGIHLRFADGEGILGLFEENRVWGEPDVVAMRLLARHLRVICRGISIRAVQPTVDLGSVLSPRQREVAALISNGCTNAQISDRLGVTEKTVKTYVSRIFDVTGLTNRAQLATAFLRSR